MQRTLRRVGLVAAAVGLAAGALVVPVRAHPISHPGPPRVRNLRPAFGEVGAAGPVAVAAQVVSDVAVASHTLRVDGIVVPSRREGDATHPTVAADLTLGAGDHVAQLDVTGSDGRAGGRAWRFTLSDLPVRRIAGDDRVATAAAVSRDLYPVPATARAAVLARSDDFADALAGAPLARAKDGPVLLTSRTGLSGSARDELTRAVPPGSTVYLLGGSSALGDRVATDVRAAGYLVERLAGASRFGTATAVADEVGPSDTVFAVNGLSFADALSASSPAGVSRAPIVLVERDRVPAETSAWLARQRVQRTYVVGGDRAVAPAVASSLPSPTRIAGPDRYATSLAVAAALFDPGVPVVAASGASFADALAGGPRAAALDGPLVLVPGRVVSDGDAFAALSPPEVVLVGGPAALPEALANEVRRVVLDAGGPRPAGFDPAPGGEVQALNPMTFEFDRDLLTAQSSVYVTMGGEEVPGTVTQGDFATSLVFTPTEIPVRPPLGQGVPVRVVVLAFDGTRWRHLDLPLTYRKLDMARGDSGPAVLELQQQLTFLGYWLGEPDGVYGLLTSQAVMAFQKVHGLARTGTVDAATRTRLADPRRAVARAPGDHIELDKARQVVLVVRGGQVVHALNTSTGTERPYEYGGQTYLANTPTGTFTITREIDDVRESRLGTLYRPKYWTSDGVAFHGSSSVPPYPASHGCARLTNAAMDWVWANGVMPIGARVIVY